MGTKAALRRLSGQLGPGADGDHDT